MSKEIVNGEEAGLTSAPGVFTRRELLRGIVGLSAGLILRGEENRTNSAENNSFSDGMSESGSDLLNGNIHGGNLFSTDERDSHPQVSSQESNYKVFVPGVAHSERKYSIEVPSTFKWQRNELLFAPNAGFQKLREGGQASVYIPPEIYGRITEQSFEPWNRLGIEIRGIPYMYLTSDKAACDIEFRSAEVTWVQPFNEKGNPDPRSPFKKSIIHIDPSANNLVAAHEAGHGAFGLADFLGKNGYEAFKNGTLKGYINPQNGADPNKPYVGAMNYEYWLNPEKWFGPDEKYALITAGYGEM